jgi:hypothetical protein
MLLPWKHIGNHAKHVIDYQWKYKIKAIFVYDHNAKYIGFSMNVDVKGDFLLGWTVGHFQKPSYGKITCGRLNNTWYEMET